MEPCALGLEAPAAPPFAVDPAAPGLGARAFVEAGRRRVADLLTAGESGWTLVRTTSAVMDSLLRGLFAALAGRGLPPVALVALGGYGRRELSPRSDLDLLLLFEGEAAPPGVRELAERILYALWDLKLEVGWGLRSPEECALLAESDHTVRAALFDARAICGDERLALRLQEALARRPLDVARFVTEKLEELRRRRARYGETVYLLEPHLKLGEGGQRDLHAALWIARARYGVDELPALATGGLLPAREVGEVASARDFLWRLRAALHELAGRKEDRLLFELQAAAAARLGFRDGAEGAAADELMRHYYLAAAAIKRAADAIVDRCEEEAAREAGVAGRPLDGEFVVRDGRAAPSNPASFAEDPAALVRLFGVLDREGLALHSAARLGVAEALERHGEGLRTAEVYAELRALFERRATRGQFLLAMHEHGLLARLLPEFARATARPQPGLWHVYTVDVHCLYTALQVFALRRGELGAEEPFATRVMGELADPLPLFVAALVHDVGKGGGGGHAGRGAPLARAVAQRLGLSPEGASDAEFLVAEHLSMSQVSQRRDLSDPGLIASFAARVGGAQRLRMLYLLTFADIRSVAPGTWNAWKAQLLEELYRKALAVLEPGAAHAAASPRASAHLRARFSAAEAERFLAAMPERYRRAVEPEEAARHLRLLRRRQGRPLAAFVRGRGDYSELTLTAADRPGLLATFAGALAAHRIDILRAAIYSTADGQALDVFAIRPPQGGPVERERWRAARADLAAALEGRLDVGELLGRRAPSALEQRQAPPVPLRVAVDNAACADATVVDVQGADRVGLLHALARALHALDLEIELATVATEGARACDAFYVRRAGGKVEDPASLAALEQALRAALAGG